MNCKNFTESPAKPRKYRADCDTSILQVRLPTQCGCPSHFSVSGGSVVTFACSLSVKLDLERGVGRTHRYLSDTTTYVKHFFGFGLSTQNAQFPRSVEFVRKLCTCYFSLTNSLSRHSLLLRAVGYTTFSYSGLKATFADGNLTVSVVVKNTGAADGAEVIQ